MNHQVSGNYIVSNSRIAIIAGRFNEIISTKLIEGASDCFLRHGGLQSDLTTYWVPGSFEVPLIAKKLAMQKNFDAIVCLGCLIRGDTSHYDLIASEVTKGMAQVSLEFVLPVINGIITAENTEQALARAGLKHGNKGSECMSAAIEMINLGRLLDKNDTY